MTTMCRIVLTVVTCTLDPETPKPTPAEAVEILRAGGTRFFIADPPLPVWLGYGSYDDPRSADDRDWPFTGALAPTWAPETRRLDGTSLFDPPIVYGMPAWPAHRGHRGRIQHRRSAGRDDLSRDREGDRADRAPGATRGPVAAPRANGRAPVRAAVGGAPVRRP
jgi:hypothetical protein